MSGRELPVNCHQRIKATIFAVVIADEAIFRPDLDVAAGPIAINQYRAERSRVGIADRQSPEAVITYQFFAGLGRIGGLWIGIDYAGRNESLFHIMPAMRSG